MLGPLRPGLEEVERMGSVGPVISSPYLYLATVQNLVSLYMWEYLWATKTGSAVIPPLGLEAW